MNIYQRYNIQKQAIYNDNADYFNEMIVNPATKLIRSLGMGAFSTLDRYIITMIETKDQRRALLDLDELDKAKEAIEKGMVKDISADLKTIVKEINKELSK